jgi:opacity protein-like surface antigen
MASYHFSRECSNQLIIHISKFIRATILLCLFLPGTLFPQNKPVSKEIGLGFELGNWRPNDLDEDVSLSFVKRTKDHPYLGIIILKPWRYSLTFRSSLGYWKFCKETSSLENRKIEIVSLLLDLKYAILSDVRLLPYVSYGFGWFFGKENQPGDPLLHLNRQWESGIGVNIGTGFDFKLTRKFFLAMEFRYHYLKFKRVIAFTDNYSGPKISFGIVYLF